MPNERLIIFRVEISLVSPKEVLMDIKENVEMDNFMSDEDFDEYKDLVEKFLTKINSY